MKSLNEVLKELEKINKEEPDTPKYNLEDLSITYRAINKIGYFPTLDVFELSAREYLVVHLQAKLQREVWNKYTFPIEDTNVLQKFEDENKVLDTKYREIEKLWL